MGHHRLTYGLGRNLVLAQAFELAHDLRHGLLDPFRIDIALAQRDLDRARELVAIERHPPAVALYHRELAQLHALKGGEAKSASETEPAPTDRGRILGRA